MDRLLSLGTAFAFFFFLTITHAQVPAPSQSLKEIDFAEERKDIPGETMGQKMESLLFWSVAEKERRFPQMHRIFPSSEVATGGVTHPLEMDRHIQPKLPEGGSVSSYMEKNNIGGLIVLKDNKIKLEAYGDGVDRKTVWTSFSVAKSVTSMLLGVALKDGIIEDLNDPLSKYIWELKGRDYGNVSVRQLLTMTSGIQWNEDYSDPNADVAQMYLQPCQDEEPHILTYMKNLKAIENGAGNFNYSTGETDLLGLLIQRATGKDLAEYLSEKIWKPYGMEHTAYWLADECSMLNLGGSGLSATLRDYARLGTVMLNHGKVGDKELFSENWTKDATSVLVPAGADGGGYGYLWWRFADGSYAAFGIFGQMIYINPKTQVVIAQFAAWPQAGSKELSAERAAFIAAVEEALR